jgi:hypothetical protein
MRHMIGRFAILALLSCGGCADTGRTAASDAEQLASANYKLCLDRAAFRLDDHGSDVPTIAARVRDACQWQSHALEETYYGGLNAGDRQGMLESLPTSESRLSAASDAVMRERAGRQPPIMWPFERQSIF